MLCDGKGFVDAEAAGDCFWGVARYCCRGT